MRNGGFRALVCDGVRDWTQTGAAGTRQSLLPLVPTTAHEEELDYGCEVSFSAAVRRGAETGWPRLTGGQENR
jgi:hypothetical protein